MTSGPIARVSTWIAVGALLVGGLASCEGGAVEPPGGDAPPDEAPVVRQPVGEPTQRPARRVRRLTAEQLHRSLEVVTGKRWSRYERFAGSLGRPDFAEVTEEGLELSVTFDKLVHDAARETCTVAIVEEAFQGGPRVLLTEASVSAPDEPSHRRNLRALLLRFHGVDVPEDDTRLDPYLAILADPPTTGPADVAGRWAAVCVALVTHPDFLTY